ncbi:MAG: zinc-dependent peptidase [Deltaproteobacteria bacterium]|nr:zinc-dependent peptidase [Deltaproteobacteria bacterium]
MFGFLRRRRRRRLLEEPINDSWLGILGERVPFFADLRGELRQRFLDHLRIFVAEKHWIEAGGMEITDEVRVVIGAAAVRLTLHLDIDVYSRLTEVVVYPSHYLHPDSEDESIVFGEAHSWGTVVLSWDAVVHGLANPADGHDTATHEFAHVLDRVDGSFDGAPELRAREHYRPWAQVMSHHYDELRDGKRRERRVLRDYGATNEAEFFAVATESFFEKPRQMKSQLPELYAELSQFYGFDPAEADGSEQ